MFCARATSTCGGDCPASLDQSQELKQRCRRKILEILTCQEEIELTGLSATPPCSVVVRVSGWDGSEEDDPLFTAAVTRSHPGTGSESKPSCSRAISSFDQLENSCLHIHRAVGGHRRVIDRQDSDRGNEFRVLGHALNSSGASPKQTGREQSYRNGDDLACHECEVISAYLRTVVLAEEE